MFRQEMGILPAAALMLAVLAAGPPAGAAETKEGGRNALTHKLPAPAGAAVRCRICAGKRCTIVRARGRCTKRSALAALEARVKQRSKPQRALPDPQLDDRSYKQLNEKKPRRRIPRHTPEWSNFNESDPGVAILKEARRNPRSIRVQPLSRRFRPEPDDEVLLGFDKGDSK